MGHNMGAHHDRANASGSGAYPYSYGYQAPDKAFRTIMAYNCSSPGCPRVNYWSNPDVLYGGQPMGVVYTAPNSADNRRTLNNTALTVANFRASCAPATPTLSAPPDGGGMCSAAPAFDWSSVSRATSYRIQVDDDAVLGSPAISTTTTASYYAHGSPLPLDTYYWRVMASNAAGDSPWSDVWDVTLVTCDERVHLPLVMSD
jgi:hypothetical protein